MASRYELPPDTPDLLTPAEVADLFRVSPTTVTRWSNTGSLPTVWTPGRTRRFPRSGVEAMLNADTGGA